MRHGLSPGGRGSPFRPIKFAPGFQHQLAQPDRSGIELGSRRIEHVLLVDAGVERRRDHLQRQGLCQRRDQPARERTPRDRCAPRYAAPRYSRARPARCAARSLWFASQASIRSTFWPRITTATCRASRKAVPPPQLRSRRDDRAAPPARRGRYREAGDEIP